MSNRARAQSLVELALIAPVLILLAMAVWDGGSLLREQVILDQAARDGARVGAMGYGQTGVPWQYVCDAVATSAADLGGVSCSQSNISYPLTGSQPSVHVSLSWTHQLYTPVLRQLWGRGTGTVVLRSTATFFLPSQTPVPAPITPSTPTPVPATGTACAPDGYFSEDPGAVQKTQGYFIVFRTSATGYVLAGWQVPSGSSEVHLYAGTPLGTGSNGRGLSLQAPSTIPNELAGGSSSTVAYAYPAVNAGTYTAYFWNKGNAVSAGSSTASVACGTLPF